MTFAPSIHRLPAGPRRLGVIGLLTVIVLGAMILSIGISASFIGQTQIVTSGQADRGQAVRELASTCVGEALQRLKFDPAFMSATVPLGPDTCTVTVSGSGSSRTIAATASSGGFTKSISATASLRQNAAHSAHAWHLDSWREVDP